MILEAYAAGLFDGEGSIYLNRAGTLATISVTVTNTDKRVCQVFNSQWGGRIIEEKREPYKLIYRWKVHGKKARPFLIGIHEYSIVKHDLITLALQWIDTIGTPKVAVTRDNIKKRATILNKIHSIKGK